jgi:hypothetical protein
MINQKSRVAGPEGPGRRLASVGCRPVDTSASRTTVVSGCHLSGGNHRGDGIVVGERSLCLCRGKPRSRPMRSPALASTVFCSVFKERLGRTGGNEVLGTCVPGPWLVGGPMSEAAGHDLVVALTSTSQHPDVQGRSKRSATVPALGRTVNQVPQKSGESFSCHRGRPDGRCSCPCATGSTGRAAGRPRRAPGSPPAGPR